MFPSVFSVSSPQTIFRLLVPTKVVRSLSVISVRFTPVTSIRFTPVVSVSLLTTYFCRSWPTVIVSSFLTSLRRFFCACIHTSSRCWRSSNMISLKPPPPGEVSLFQVERVLCSGSR